MATIKLNLSGHDNAELAELGFITHKLHVDLADPNLCQKVAGFLADTCGVGSSDTVQLALPGLGALAVIVCTAVHGLTGQHGTIFPLVRNADGSFSPAAPIDLQSFRNDLVRSKHREGVVIL